MMVRKGTSKALPIKGEVWAYAPGNKEREVKVQVLETAAKNGTTLLIGAYGIQGRVSLASFMREFFPIKR